MKYLPSNPELTETSEISVQDGLITFRVQVLTFLQTKPVPRLRQASADAFASVQPEQIVSGVDIPGYSLLFNKYNVSERHYLLVSKDFAHQLELLDSGVFAAIEGMHGVFSGHCFFNGGRLSGSSQPRRHVQFVDLRAPLDDFIISQEFRFGVCHTLSIYDNTLNGIVMLNSWSEKELSNAYEELLSHCKIRLSEPIFRQDIPEDYPERPEFPEIRQIQQVLEPEMCQIALDSYSLIIGQTYMFMCKRCKDGGFNSISFSGSIFVKSQQLCDELVASGILRSLRECIAPLD